MYVNRKFREFGMDAEAIVVQSGDFRDVGSVNAQRSAVVIQGAGLASSTLAAAPAPASEPVGGREGVWCPEIGACVVYRGVVVRVAHVSKNVPAGEEPELAIALLDGTVRDTTLGHVQELAPWAAVSTESHCSCDTQLIAISRFCPLKLQFEITL
eukprot:SAG11_NODE_325_length_10712_cov_15.479883_1_plen_155_part_00